MSICDQKEITQNEKVTSEQSRASKTRGWQHKDLSGGGDGGGGLCESTLCAFKWFHYFLNPFWN